MRIRTLLLAVILITPLVLHAQQPSIPLRIQGWCAELTIGGTNALAQCNREMSLLLPSEAEAGRGVSPAIEIRTGSAIAPNIYMELGYRAQTGPVLAFDLRSVNGQAAKGACFIREIDNPHASDVTPIRLRCVINSSEASFGRLVYQFAMPKSDAAGAASMAKFQRALGILDPNRQHAAAPAVQVPTPESENPQAQQQNSPTTPSATRVPDSVIEELRLAQAAYKQGNYMAAARILRPLADKGYYLPQRLLGTLYENGQGVPKDNRQAEFWYRKAAENGDAVSQAILGVGIWVRDGVDGPEKDKEMVKWLRMASDQGEANAQFILGRAFDSGRGVKKDSKQAVLWYRKAADQGNNLAEHYLGMHYILGDGVPKNEQLGTQLIRKSADSGNPAAKKTLSDLQRTQIQSRQGASANIGEQVNCAQKCNSDCTVYGPNTGAFGKLDYICLNACTGVCETVNRINEYGATRR